MHYTYQITYSPENVRIVFWSNHLIYSSRYIPDRTFVGPVFLPHGIILHQTENVPVQNVTFTWFYCQLIGVLGPIGWVIFQVS